MPDIQSDFHIQVGNGDWVLPEIAKKYVDDIEINESYNDTTEMVLSLDIMDSLPISIHNFVKGKPISCDFITDRDFMGCFYGEIFKVSRTLSKEGNKLTITCYDISYRLKFDQEKQSIITDKEVTQLHDLTKNTFLNQVIKNAGYQEVVIEPYKKLLPFDDGQSIIVGSTENKTYWAGLVKLAWLNGLRLISRGRTLYMVDDKFIAKGMSSKDSLVWDPTPEQKENKLFTTISRINIDENIMSKDRDVAAIFWTNKIRKKPINRTKVEDTEIKVQKKLIDLSNLDLSSTGFDTIDKTKILTLTDIDVIATVEYDPEVLEEDRKNQLSLNEAINRRRLAESSKFIFPNFMTSRDERLKTSEDDENLSDIVLGLNNYQDLKSGKIDFKSLISLANQNIKTTAQAQRVVDKEVENNNVLMITGDADIQGNPYIKMGQFIPIITNVKADWNSDMEGKYFIESTKLKYNKSDGFTMNVGIARPYFWKILETNKVL